MKESADRRDLSPPVEAVLVSSVEKSAADANEGAVVSVSTKATQSDGTRRPEPEPSGGADDLLALIREHDEPRAATVIRLDTRRRGTR
ncbi:MAG: hypothetical protein U0270_07725 [Labilithrix sp.]